MKAGFAAFFLLVGIVALMAAIIANYGPFYVIAFSCLSIFLLFLLDPTRKRKFRISHTKIYPGGRQENEIIEVYTTKKALIETLRDGKRKYEGIDELDENGKMTILFRNGPTVITAIYQILH
ncbi:MAG: hypothetical protein II053_04645 [Bacteroidales bacterium]|nr:hypothetical protein [Bacteroidales bacterium]